MENAQFKIIKLEESPYIEKGAKKFTESLVEYEYSGALVGTSKVRYLMHYLQSGKSFFTALEYFEGTYREKEGSFSMIHNGSDQGTDDLTEAELKIIPGSGTGELQNISGTAKIQLEGHKDSYPISLKLKV